MSHTTELNMWLQAQIASRHKAYQKGQQGECCWPWKSRATVEVSWER